MNKNWPAKAKFSWFLSGNKYSWSNNQVNRLPIDYSIMNSTIQSRQILDVIILILPNVEFEELKLSPWKEIISHEYMEKINIEQSNETIH